MALAKNHYADLRVNMNEIRNLWPTRPIEVTFPDLIRHVGRRYSAPTQVQQQVRNALVLEELVGAGYGYQENEWQEYKSKIPPGFWKLADLEVEKVLSGHAVNEITVIPVDRPDSFQAFERGVDYQKAGGIALYKEITFKAEDVTRVWP